MALQWNRETFAKSHEIAMRTLIALTMVRVGPLSRIDHIALFGETYPDFNAPGCEDQLRELWPNILHSLR